MNQKFHSSKYLFLVAIFLLNISFLRGQSFDDLHTTSNKAKKSFKKGTANLQKGKLEEAKEDLLAAIKVDGNFIEAYQVLGETYEYLRDKESAKAQYYKVIKLDPKFFPNTFFALGKLELDIGNYKKAKDNFIGYTKSSGKSVTMDEDSHFNIEICDFAIEAIKSPVPFDPLNMGENINTEHAEYLPAITADEQIFIFTKRLPIDNSMYNFQEDFYVSFKRDGEWSSARSLGPPINTKRNEGAQCISPDGQYIFFTACNRNDGMGKCDLYVSRLEGTNWSKPANLERPINTGKWESQPCISSDGGTIYYSSNRRGSFGNNTEDIWMCQLNETGEWNIPVNLGSKINSKKSEQSPFIHPDNQTLYFSSNGHVGMGGFDLYVSRRQSDGEWGDPENLGYPINTHGNENSLIVNLDGTYAYFASNGLEGFGSMDIFSFELHEKARPQTVTYVKGNVFDSKSHKKLFATFEFIDLSTGEKVIESTSSQFTGDFLVCLPANKNYALNVSKNGYLFFSESYFLKEEAQHDPILMNVPLNPIEVGGKVVLKNIFFETGSADLKPESKGELNKLVSFLKKNQKLKVEIGGHTDNVGNVEDNELLSEYRAYAVLEYLFEKKINPARLLAKGYGETQPIATNDTSKGRAKNRRTEFKIVEK